MKYTFNLSMGQAKEASINAIEQPVNNFNRALCSYNDSGNLFL